MTTASPPGRRPTIVAPAARPVVVSFTGPRSVAVVDEDVPDLVPGTVRVRTRYSGISAGTELTAYRGSNVHLIEHWDPARRLFGGGGVGGDGDGDGGGDGQESAS